MKKRLITFSILLLIMISGCSSSSVDPEEKTYPPGERNYQWEKISLNDKAPLNTYFKLWGNDPNDIWIIGGAGDLDKTIIRYNGTGIKYPRGIQLDPRAIFGFGPNEIWFGGPEFDIWKYNGSSVSKYTQMPIDGFVNSYFGDMWGDASNNVLAVGSVTEQSSGKIKGTILKYDGQNWKYIIDPKEEVFYAKVRRDSKDGKYYLVGIRIRSSIPDSSDFYEFDGINVKPVYVGKGIDPIGKSITIMDGIIYFSYEKEIYKKTEAGIKHYISLKSSLVNGVLIWGRNENDFFIQTKDGIGHYNGNNLETIYPIGGNFGIFDGLVLENDIYFIGYDKDTFNFFLIHGIKS